MGEIAMMKKGKNSFWVSILNVGIRIGIATKEHDLKTLVGDTRDTWAINSNGDVCHDGVSKWYTQELMTGDVIRVTLNRWEGQCRFYINEKEYGIAYEDEWLKDMVLYPAVSLLDGA